MNLVAKEFCAAQVDERGVLVLSEFAGASPELRHGALLVNPNDFIGVAQAIYQACQMLPSEKRQRMHLLREIVKSQNVHRWARSFLDASATASVPKRRHRVAASALSKSGPETELLGLLCWDGHCLPSGSPALGSPRLEPTDWFSSIELKCG